MTTQFFKLNKDIITTIEESDLTSGESLTLIMLSILSDNDKGICFAKNETIGKMVGVSGNRVSRLIASLAKKGIINVKNYKKGTIVNINNTNYPTYRIITIVNIDNTFSQDEQEGMCDDNNTPHVEINKGGLFKSTNNNKTNINYTKSNLSSSLTEKQGSEREDNYKSETQALFDYALDKIKDNSRIGDKASYAKVMVKNWKKQGIKSVDELEKSMAKTSLKRPRIVEKMPYWYNSKVNNSQPNKENSVDIKADIERLKAKIG